MRCGVAYEAGVRSGVGGGSRGGGGIQANDTARSVRGERKVPLPSLALAAKASCSARKRK